VKPENYICRKNQNFEFLKDISLSDSENLSENSYKSIKDKWNLIKNGHVSLFIDSRRRNPLSTKIYKENNDDRENLEDFNFNDYKIQLILNEIENEIQGSFYMIQTFIKKLVPQSQTFIIEKKRATF